MEFLLDRTNAEKCRSRCEYLVEAQGPIEANSAEGFARAISEVPPKARVTVFLDSPGGSVIGAINLGREFRKAKVTIIVGVLQFSDGQPSLQAGHCYSSCAYAMIGGAERTLLVGSKIGIHKMTARKNTGIFGFGNSIIYDDGNVRTLLIDYAQEMGVDTEFVDAAERLYDGNIKILTDIEMNEWRVLHKKSR